MKKIMILTMIFATVAMGMTSCKKYEDDSNRSWSSPKSRLLGTWKSDVTNGEGVFDGLDSTITFEKDGKGYLLEEVSVLGMKVSEKQEFKWEFGEKKNSLIVTLEEKDGNSTFIEKLEFKILQLTKKSLWGEYKVEFAGTVTKTVLKYSKV